MLNGMNKFYDNNRNEVLQQDALDFVRSSETEHFIPDPCDTVKEARGEDRTQASAHALVMAIPGRVFYHRGHTDSGLVNECRIVPFQTG